MTDKLTEALHIVFDGPPGPEAGRFVEVETPDGRSVNAGEWHERADGLWELRLAMQFASPRPTGDVVKTIQRALRRFVSEQDEATWQLPTIQFISNRDDLIAERIVAALATLQPASPPTGDVVEALDNLRISARRVSNKYGRVGDTDEFSDWTEWVNVRDHCDAADTALATLQPADPVEPIAEKQLASSGSCHCGFWPCATHQIDDISDPVEPKVGSDVEEADEIDDVIARLEVSDPEAASYLKATDRELTGARNEIATLRASDPSRELVERYRAALDRIATVDMGGGFLGAFACREVARAALAQGQSR